MDIQGATAPQTRITIVAKKKQDPDPIEPTDAAAVTEPSTSPDAAPNEVASEPPTSNDAVAASNADAELTPADEPTEVAAPDAEATSETDEPSPAVAPETDVEESLPVAANEEDAPTVALAATSAETTALADTIFPTAVDAAPVAPATADAPSANAADGNVYAWLPAEKAEKPRKKRRWPWIAIPAAGVVAGLVIASMNLIAPGVSAAGVPVGGMTQAGAEDAITDRVENASVTIKSAGKEVTLTGADLGAQIDAKALANEAFTSSPAWNVSKWGNSSVTGALAIDEQKTTDALRAALPDAYTDATDAKVTFDTASNTYTVTPSIDGTGIPVETVVGALEKAITSEGGTTNLTIEPQQIPAVITTAEAQSGVDELNTLVASTGFFIGDENVAPVSAATVSTWITPTIDADGKLTVTANKDAINQFTSQLAATVDRPVQNGVWLVDRDGKQLKDSNYTKEGIQGRTIGDTSQIASQVATQLEAGDGHVELTVTTVEPVIEKRERWIEVNISEQTVYVWENDQIVRTMLTSSGLSPHDSATGTFRINSHITQQSMGCVPGYDYCVEEVPWVMFYNGDEAFHGAPWNSNLGTPQSHGCMNLSVDNAKWLWDWTPLGTEVWVHY